jgi:cytochrome c553
MNKQILWLILGAAAVVSCGPHAQETRNSAALTGPDIEFSMAQGFLDESGAKSESAARGARVVVGLEPCKRGLKCFSCFQCHGIRGEGGVAAAQPRLAGQNADYLASTLQRFASGERQNATMHEVASALTPQQMSDVAAYYSVMKVSSFPAPAREEGKSVSVNEVGQRIAQQGLADHAVPACITCHAIARTAGAPYPYLSGQFSDYLAQQLQNFRNGTRRGEQATVMQTIARNLSQEQGQAVAEYYGTLAPKTAPGLPQKPSAAASP